MLGRTTVRHVLWHQDLSRLKPPVILSGLVGGTHALARYSDANARTRAASIAVASAHTNTTSADASPFTFSQTASVASPVSVENVSDGSPFLAFTPCDAHDLAALLTRLSQQRCERSALSDTSPSLPLPAQADDTTAEATIALMRETLAENMEILAAAASLDTGVPLNDARAALTAALAFLAPPPPSTDACAAADAAVPWTQSRPQTSTHPSIVLLLTAPDFSLMHGLCATARYLRSCRSTRVHRLPSLSSSPSSSAHGKADVVPDVVWCPPTAASLSAQWWMWCLREKLRQQRTPTATALLPNETLAPVCRLPTPVRCHTVLLADPVKDLAQAISAGYSASCSRLPADQERDSTAAQTAISTQRPMTRPSVHVRHVGFTSAAACADQTRFRTALARAPVPCAVDEDAEARDAPALALVLPMNVTVRSSPSTPPLPVLSAEAIAEELLFECGVCRRVPHFADHSSSMPSDATASPSPSRAVRPRCPLVLMPEGGTPCVLHTLVRQHLRRGGATLMGHSLDGSARLGPLHSAAHLEAAQTTLHAAIAPAPRDSSTAVHRVVWQQVAGGFALPLTATTAAGGRGGDYWVPTVLHVALSTVRTSRRSTPSTYTRAEPAGTDADSDASVAQCQAALTAVCASVQALTQELEIAHGGTSGVVLFVCSYAAHVADTVDLAAQAGQAARLCGMDLEIVRLAQK